MPFQKNCPVENTFLKAEENTSLKNITAERKEEHQKSTYVGQHKSLFII